MSGKSSSRGDSRFVECRGVKRQGPSDGFDLVDGVDGACAGAGTVGEEVAGATSFGGVAGRGVLRVDMVRAGRGFLDLSLFG